MHQRILSYGLPILLLVAIVQCGESSSAPDRQKAQAYYDEGHQKHTKDKDLEEARKLYEEAHKADPTWWRPAYQLAWVHSLLGNTDDAIQYLRKAVEIENSPELRGYLSTDSDLNSLRSHPEFQKLIQQGAGNSKFAGSYSAQNCETVDNLPDSPAPPAYAFTLGADGKFSSVIMAGPTFSGSYTLATNKFTLNLSKQQSYHPDAGELEAGNEAVITANVESRDEYICLSEINSSDQSATMPLATGCYCR